MQHVIGVCFRVAVEWLPLFAASGAKASASSMRKGTTKIPGKEDILAQLEAQRVKQAEQLKVEARARQELEDMLLRIERHFKVGTVQCLTIQ